MATYTFDGTSSITATKNDTVLINVDPQTFTQATDNGSSVTLAFGSQSVTVTGTTFVDGGLPNVFVSGGVFAYGATPSVNTLGSSATGNELVVLGNGATFTQAQTTTASSKLAIFGGLGRVDAADSSDTITIGGKGNFLVFGDAGNDTVNQTAGAAGAFDSTSVVNISGDAGNDTITLTNAANDKASIFVGGGAGTGTDTISVNNAGATTILGGVDSNDGADTITFNAVSGGAAGGAGGTSQIFGNGGGDTITVGGTNALDSTSTTTIYGGFGNDGITVTGTKAAVNVLGGEGADTINVTNNGNTYITGGLQSGDQSNDSADTITFTGSGNALIYGNVGNDTITTTLGNTAVVTDTTNISIYGGKDNDTINQTIGAGVTGKATVFIAGGEGQDTITATGNGGAVTIYGGISSSDSTDSADTISYSGGGVANIFANGGADTVNIGTIGTADSTNATVTVYGGGGNDSINVAAQTSTSQALVLNGNEGADTFSIAKGAGQSVTIGDFTVGSGNDKLALTGLGGTPGTLQVATGTYQTLQDALNGAAKAAGGTAAQAKAGAVVFSGSTYVVIDNTAGDTFTPATDQAIKLTGVTDLLGVAANTTVSAA